MKLKVKDFKLPFRFKVMFAGLDLPGDQRLAFMNAIHHATIGRREALRRREKTQDDE